MFWVVEHLSCVNMSQAHTGNSRRGTRSHSQISRNQLLSVLILYLTQYVDSQAGSLDTSSSSAQNLRDQFLRINYATVLPGINMTEIIGLLKTTCLLLTFSIKLGHPLTSQIVGAVTRHQLSIVEVQTPIIITVHCKEAVIYCTL